MLDRVTVNTYVEELVERFQKRADEEAAQYMIAYMKGQYDFFGIKAPVRREITIAYLKEKGIPEDKNLAEIILELWKRPQRELQNVAIDILERRKSRVQEQDIVLYEELIVTKSWWDTVDGLASSLVGHYFIQYPDQRDSILDRWITSDNIWLKRSAILFQLKYKDRTDATRLFRYIEQCIPSQEFFINKAIGWALRQYAKYNPSEVIAFVESHHLSNLSRREALKLINK